MPINQLHDPSFSTATCFTRLLMTHCFKVVLCYLLHPLDE